MGSLALNFQVDIRNDLWALVVTLAECLLYSYSPVGFNAGSMQWGESTGLRVQKTAERAGKQY